MINWKVRLKNKIFWATIIPLLFLLVHRVLSLFGIEFDFSDLQTKVLDIVEIIFAILTALGIVTDLTTDGVSDSIRALTYEEPYKDK